MMTKYFIIPAHRRRIQCADRLCNHSRRIILAARRHPERPRILHPIYRKLPNLEFLLTRLRKKWLHKNTPLLHMKCMRVGRGITMFRIAVIVDVVSVSCSAGTTVVVADAFSATVALRTEFPLTHPRSSRIPPTLIPLHQRPRRPLNGFVNHATMQ